MFDMGQLPPAISPKWVLVSGWWWLLVAPCLASVPLMVDSVQAFGCTFKWFTCLDASLRLIGGGGYATLRCTIICYRVGCFGTCPVRQDHQGIAMPLDLKERTFLLCVSIWLRSNGSPGLCSHVPCATYHPLRGEGLCPLAPSYHLIIRGETMPPCRTLPSAHP